MIRLRSVIKGSGQRRPFLTNMIGRIWLVWSIFWIWYRLWFVSCTLDGVEGTFTRSVRILTRVRSARGILRSWCQTFPGSNIQSLPKIFPWSNRPLDKNWSSSFNKLSSRASAPMRFSVKIATCRGSFKLLQTRPPGEGTDRKLHDQSPYATTYPNFRFFTIRNGAWYGHSRTTLSYWTFWG